jgi:hypothetical protein
MKPYSARLAAARDARQFDQLQDQMSAGWAKRPAFFEQCQAEAAARFAATAPATSGQVVYDGAVAMCAGSMIHTFTESSRKKGRAVDQAVLAKAADSGCRCIFEPFAVGIANIKSVADMVKFRREVDGYLASSPPAMDKCVSEMARQLKKPQ